MTGAVLLLTLQAAPLRVGAGGAYSTVAEALARAGPGDTVVVSPGTYIEHLTISRPVVLLGEPGAVLSGGGTGVVLTITARATVRGLTLRESGRDLSREDAGIIALGADSLVIEDNVLDDVLFGVYLKECQAPLIRNNVVEGKSLSPGARGDGIRLWYSHDGRIIGNRVRQTRDVVIWFSDRTEVTGNRVTDGRYGLHYMYSRGNRFERNVFLRNEVGAFIMYSQDIVFRENVFADARGRIGRGLGFKDADRISAERNLLVKNSVGISLDNSPSALGAVNEFRGNVLAYNDVGVAMLPSVQSNVFEGNQFRDNVQPVSVTGGGTALANTWRDNYWTDYAGFDRDGDGVGDTPYVFERLSDDLLARHGDLQVFNLSPAAAAMNTISHVLPLLKPEPMLVDSAPRLATWPGPEAPGAPADPRGQLVAAAALALIAVGAALCVPWGRHPFRRAA